ncbi:MAG: class I SAM-dependent methyltransferase [Actinobacteria bacterium]|nr:class I SAM-dependent methyltransferase [Actinomycetota bacterium]
MTLFHGIDWGAEWIAAQKVRRKPDSAEYWDGRAHAFKEQAGQSAYLETFLDFAALREGETVFDMGCGSGTLSIPLAKQGHDVIAADFSPKMLEYLEQEARDEGLTNIRTVLAAWEDDWLAAGIEEVDVVVASRSIAVADLEAALKKIDAMAKRRVCITVSATDSPRYDRILWDAIGRPAYQNHDYVYCMNILFSMDRRPELRYIDSFKVVEYATYEDAVASIRLPLHEMTPEEELLFGTYCKEHIVQTKNDGGHLIWTRNYRQYTSWAFISWNK